jgi:amino acid transporter
VFARLHPRFQSPAPAVLAAGACNIGGIFLGKGAIEPITDMSAMVLTLTYGMCCWTVLRIRRRGFQAQGTAANRNVDAHGIHLPPAPAATAVTAHTGSRKAAVAAIHADVTVCAATPGVKASVGSSGMFGDGGNSPRKGAATWLIWLGLAGSTLMAACAFLTPFWQQPGFPLEYRLLIAWGLMGYIVWRCALTQQSDPDSPNTRAPS